MYRRLLKKLKEDEFTPLEIARPKALRAREARARFLAGFTLLEMVISTGIFSVVVVSSIGITLAIKTAQEKSSNIQNVQDNIRYAVEFMTKELRQGTLYRPANCQPFGGMQQCGKMYFRSASGEDIWYCLSGGAILRRVDSFQDTCAVAGVPLTAAGINISQLFFYIKGDAPGPADGQPRVTVVISGASKDPRVQLQSSFKLQTTVTQRVRDL
ncbi:MAG: hypothetical protein HYT40_03415 [Candidatus Sungbacteria bacterium]|uniref:Type II secretion system protein n=1 Tax=Candidatus Sungiibacteriota bacterium TaxID=2750080 RepID=A0A931WPW3_9BACT|nr:hypothetical protein [Candidatus Sungbacteria bacterium]